MIAASAMGVVILLVMMKTLDCDQYIHGQIGRKGSEQLSYKQSPAPLEHDILAEDHYEVICESISSIRLHQELVNPEENTVGSFGMDKAVVKDCTKC